jgi:hypothetical protein
MLEIEYLTDKDGKPKAVVIPIEVWKRIFAAERVSEDELSTRLEDL